MRRDRRSRERAIVAREVVKAGEIKNLGIYIWIVASSFVEINGDKANNKSFLLGLRCGDEHGRAVGEKN